MPKTRIPIQTVCDCGGPVGSLQRGERFPGSYSPATRQPFSEIWHAFRDRQGLVPEGYEKAPWPRRYKERPSRFWNIPLYSGAWISAKHQICPMAEEWSAVEI